MHAMYSTFKDTQIHLSYCSAYNFKFWSLQYVIWEFSDINFQPEMDHVITDCT